MIELDTEAAAEALVRMRDAYLNVDGLMAALLSADDKPSQSRVIALNTNFALLKIALGDLAAAGALRAKGNA